MSKTITIINLDKKVKYNCSGFSCKSFTRDCATIKSHCMTRNSKIISSHFNWHSKTKKKERKKCLMSVYLTKVRQTFTSNFLDLKKKTDLNISTRSISEILTLFKKFAVMYNQNLEIHSGWSFKQYFKFDYRMRHIHYYFKSKIMFISPKIFKIFTKYRSHSPGNRYMSLLHRWIAKPHRFPSI